MRDSFLAALGVPSPIVVAPMGGGGTTPALVVAAGEAGALGILAGAYLAPDEIRRQAAEIRSATRAPFGINLFAPVAASPPLTAAAVERALARVAPFFAELGLPAPAVPASGGHDFDAQLEAALDCGASVFSFTFGALPAATVERIKRRGMTVVGTATTVEEGIALERVGCDAVVAQGSEAGAHRGTFLGTFEASMVGTMALVPQLVDAAGVPVLASGGIMDGRGIAAALALGASGVQMGTAFLVSDEAGIPDAYKRAILAAREDQTRLTRVFSGRAARGIVNRVVREVPEDEILPYPLQNALTRPLRAAAAQRGDVEYLSLWTGQGTRLARRLPAGELVARLRRETAEAIAGLHRIMRSGATET